ncbi:outer membrane protein [Chitinophaga costaii]|uniref:Outer membrane protein n=1 Tax=Chitinophaga costaii TaxID=1335309 RepID=A0A1C4DDT5_9BACT|nr:TolC family protein [Chitinophaga costaii]PUZ24582.1 TolC family protein [Chitinophaga costaii]SCC29501.1 outer membrane protein [Chitinophaga costaii]
MKHITFKCIFLFTILCCCYCKPLQAQDTAKWSLQQCLDYAARNNITINTLRLQQRSGEQDVLLAKAAKLPNLTGSGTQNLQHGKVFSVDGSAESQWTLSGSYGLSSGITIFNGQYLNNDIRQKQLLLQQAAYNIEQGMNDITMNITTAYLNILLAKETILYQQDLLNTAVAQVKQSQDRYNVGSIALRDLAELQAQQANDRYQLVNALNQHRQYLLNLKQLLQLPYDSTFDIVSPDTLMANALPTPLRQAQETALAQRPEVKSSELNVQAAQLDLAKARSGYLPTLTAGANVATSYARDPDYTYLKQLDNNFYQQIGLTLSVPIFTRRVVKTNVEKSKIEIAQAQLDLQNTRTTLAQNVEQAYINVQGAQSQYDAAVEQLRYSQESYRIATAALQVGQYNTVDYLLQKNLYVQALQNYIQAKYNAALSIRIYDFYRGIPIKL